MTPPETTFRRLGGLWDKFFFQPGDAFKYSFFRVAFAGLLLIHHATTFPSLGFFYSEQGFLPFPTSQLVIDPGAWTIFTWLPKNDATLWTVYWVFVATTLTLLLGVFSRCSAIVVYICLVSFQHRNNLITDGEDAVMRTFGLMLIFMPLGKFLSVDRAVAILRGKISPAERTAAPAALRIIQVYMCLIYFSSCWWKLKGSEWVDGTAMYYVSRLDDLFGRLPTPKFFFESMPMTKAITWSVIGLEALTPLLVWFKETRRPILLIALLFHLACEYSMNLFLFHWLMILGWMCFLSDGEIHRLLAFTGRLFRRVGIRPVTLGFNGQSTFSRRIVAVLAECDLLSLLRFDNDRASGTIGLKTKDGKKLEGFVAVRYALRSVPVTWLLLPLLYLPGAAVMADRWFRLEPEFHAQPG